MRPHTTAHHIAAGVAETNADDDTIWPTCVCLSLSLSLSFSSPRRERRPDKPYYSAVPTQSLAGLLADDISEKHESKI